MGNKSRKDMRSKKKRLEQVKALLESKTMAEAYKKTHPNSSDKSAKANASRMWNDPQLIKEFQEALAMDKPMKVNRENLEKLLQIVAVRWMNGQEKTSDFLKAVENLQKLVPDFVDRKLVSDYERMSDEDLDNEIKKLMNGSEQEET